MKRLIVEVTPDDHTAVKELATQEGVSMKRWILKAIAYYIRGTHGKEEILTKTGD